MDKIIIAIRCLSLICLTPFFLFTVNKGWEYVILVLPWLWIWITIHVTLIVLAAGLWELKNWARIAFLWIAWLVFLDSGSGLHALQIMTGTIKVGMLSIFRELIPLVIVTIFLNWPTVKVKFK